MNQKTRFYLLFKSRIKLKHFNLLLTIAYFKYYKIYS